MTAIVYACTHVAKHTQVDDFETGCDAKLHCNMSERCGVATTTFQGLIEALNKRFWLAIDDLWIGNQVEDGVTRVGFSRLEDGDSNVPSQPRCRSGRGKLTLYLADYDFAIEKRAVEPIALDEIRAEGVKFHR